jgi:hypothetical protein
MDTLASIARWVLFGSVYGLFGVAALIYFLLKLVKRKVPRFPEPALVVVPLFIIGLLVLPSIPRYEFERSALSQVIGKPWIRVINQTQWGEISQNPLRSSARLWVRFSPSCPRIRSTVAAIAKS